MKKLFIFLFLLIALTMDVSAAQVTGSYDYTNERLTGFSMTRKVPVIGLSEMEKANNALATVFDRTPPHAEPVLVNIRSITNYPRQK